VPAQNQGGGGGPAYASTDIPRNYPTPPEYGSKPSSTSQPAKPKKKQKSRRKTGSQTSRSTQRTRTHARPDPNNVVAIITKVAQKHGIPPEVALALAKYESGIDPTRPGDGGHSIGLYQLYDAGLGAGMSVADREDPEKNAEVALAHLAMVRRQHPNLSWGQVAAISQNPADHAAEAHAVDSIVSGYHGSGQNIYHYFRESSGGGGSASTAGQGIDASGAQFDQSLLESQYGSIAESLKDTELQGLVAKAVNQGWSDDVFLAHLQDSKFYKKHSDAQRNWLLLQSTDPGEARHELAKQVKAVTNAAIQLGVHLAPDEIQHLAQQSLLNGWADDSAKLQSAIGAHFKMKQAHASGAAGSLQDQFNELANEYGIKVSDNTVGRWIKRNFTGRMSPDDVKTFFEQQAMALYPGLTDQIKQGHSVADIAGTYRDQMAQLLELDPNSVDVFDPTIRKALQYQPDPSKPSTLMPLWQFEQMVRKDPRWLNTSNAKQSAMDTGIQILKDWGLAG
jgi:hypothetical protein